VAESVPVLKASWDSDVSRGKSSKLCVVFKAIGVSIVDEVGKVRLPIARDGGADARCRAQNSHLVDDTRNLFSLHSTQSITLHHSPPQSHEQSHDTTTQHAGEERPIAQLSCHSAFIGTLMRCALTEQLSLDNADPFNPPRKPSQKLRDS
jgi:hypothetical protein